MSTFTFPYGLEMSRLDDLLEQKCLSKKVTIKKTETAEEDKPENKEIIPDPDKEKIITGNSDERVVQQPSQLFSGVAGDPTVSEEHADVDEPNPKKVHHDRVEEKKPPVEGPAQKKSQPLPETPVDIPVADKENDYNGNSWRARPKNSLLKEAERVKNNANNKIITIQVEKKNWIDRLFEKFNALFSKTDFLENAALAVCLCFVAAVGWYLSTVYDNNDTDSKAVEQPAAEQNKVNNVNNTSSAESIQTLFVDYHQGKIKEQDVLRLFTPNAYFLLTNGKDYIGMPDDPNHSINKLLSGDYLTDQHYKVSEVVLNESAGLIETLILQK